MTLFVAASGVRLPSGMSIGSSSVYFVCCCSTSGPGYISRYSDLLRAGRSRDRIPVEATFSAPVHTGPGAHPSSYSMGTGSFPGVKWPGRGVDHPPPSSSEVKERAELYLPPPYFRHSWSVLG